MEKCEALFLMNFKPINKYIRVSYSIFLELGRFNNKSLNNVEWKQCEPKSQFPNLYECRFQYNDDNNELKQFAFCFRL